MLAVILVAVPLAAALLMFLPWPRLRQWLAVLATLVVAGALLVCTLTSGVPRGEIWPGLMGLDPLGFVTLAIVAAVGLTATLYSVGYLHFSRAAHPVSQREHRRYFVLLMAFYAALLWVPLALNVLWLWILIEATALASVFLVDFQKTKQTMEASWKYLVMMEIGGAASLLGTMIILLGEPGGEHYVTWLQLLKHGHGIPALWLKLGFSLLVIGYGIKAGLVPLHAWLPDAHSQAPSPVSAMLSGIKINVALYAILRFYDIMVAGGQGSFAAALLRGIGLLTVLVAVAMTGVQRDYKRLFAYSSTENMGLIVLGYTLGPLGVYGAMLQMVNHAVIKPGLFYLSGNLLIAHGSTEIGRVRGAVYSLPWTGRLLLLMMLAIAGAPPFGLFISEFMILLSALYSRLVWLGIALVVLLALLFANFLRYALEMVFGRASTDGGGGERGNWLTVLPPLLHLLASLAMGLALPPVWQQFLRLGKWY